MSVVLPRPPAVDVALAAALLTLGQLTTWLQLDSADAFAGSRPVNAAVLALGVLPVLWRRYAPTVVVATSAAFLCLPHLVVDLDVTVLGQFVPLIVITASCAYHASAGRALLGVACAVTGMLAVSWATPFLRTPTSLVFNCVVLVAPWAAARGLRHREDRARRLGAALARERTASEARMAEAVERERVEIARDLHDIVAHGVSVMVVQIGGARMQLAESPDRAAESLLRAEDAGRQALTELRRMLGVLRTAPMESPTPGPAAGPTSSATDAEPRPGLRDLDALVARAGGAGLHVATHATGDLDRLSPALDISAYRIVQEALTNVLKHSDAARAEVRLRADERELSITVRDPGPRRPPPDGAGRGGYGLVGIHERTAFLGGRARSGPDAGGGWAVEAVLPRGGVAAVPPGAQRTVPPAAQRTHS